MAAVSASPIAVAASLSPVIEAAQLDELARGRVIDLERRVVDTELVVEEPLEPAAPAMAGLTGPHHAERRDEAPTKGRRVAARAWSCVCHACVLPARKDLFRNLAHDSGIMGLCASGSSPS